MTECGDDYYDIVFMDIRMPRMHGHIAKPLDVNVLAKILKKWIP